MRKLYIVAEISKSGKCLSIKVGRETMDGKFKRRELARRYRSEKATLTAMGDIVAFADELTTINTEK